jgi:Protein of unknown function (DUF3592)
MSILIIISFCFLFLSGIVFIYLGLGLIALHGETMNKTSIARENWPSTEGIIKSSKTKTLNETNKGMARNDVSYSADIIYTYSVNGQQLKGDKIWFTVDNSFNYWHLTHYAYSVNNPIMDENNFSISVNYRSSNKEQLQKIVDEYPVGAKVNVYYNLDNPVTSVLIPNTSTSTYIFYSLGWLSICIGCSIILIFIIIMLYPRKKKLRKN